MNAMSANFLTDHTATRHRRNTSTPASATHSGPACGSNSVTGQRWYCWKASPGDQFAALRELSAQGFRPYLPLYVARREKDREVIRPLFGSYGFVSFDLSQRWQAIHSTRGVAHLFSSSPQRPSAVPPGVVEALQARGRPGDGVIDDQYQGPAFPDVAGQTVRITAGPFADLHGLCRWSNQKRVSVLLEVMGRLVETQIQRCDVAQVAKSGK